MDFPSSSRPFINACAGCGMIGISISDPGIESSANSSISTWANSQAHTAQTMCFILLFKLPSRNAIWQHCISSEEGMERKWGYCWGAEVSISAPSLRGTEFWVVWFIHILWCCPVWVSPLLMEWCLHLHCKCRLTFSSACACNCSWNWLGACNNTSIRSAHFPWLTLCGIEYPASQLASSNSWIING